jgi:hypothetical protein
MRWAGFGSMINWTALIKGNMGSVTQFFRRDILGEPLKCFLWTLKRVKIEGPIN